MQNYLEDHGDYIEVYFRYDSVLVERIKSVAGRSYSPKKRCWKIPFSSKSIEGLNKVISNYSFYIPESLRDKMSNTVEKAKIMYDLSASLGIDSLDIAGLSGKLRPFQKSGVLYALQAIKNCGGCIIGDEMGLGKTVEAIAVLQSLNNFPALIVCPATLKLNWKNEISKWLPQRTVDIWNGKNNADILIINYESLYKYRVELKNKEFKAIVFDECHYIKNKDSQRFKASRFIVEQIPVKLFLSGTVILNHPKELLTVLMLLNILPKLGVKDSWNYLVKYCDGKQTIYGWNFDGASNTKELNTVLRSTCYIRRLKTNVLSELPEKQRVVVPFNISKKDANLIKEDIKNVIGKYKEAKEYKKNEEASLPGLISQIERIKQAVVELKFDGIIEWIENFLESGEKLVVFAHHIDFVQRIAQRFNAQYLDGTTTTEHRQKAVEDFQNNPNTKLIVLGIKVGGVGITLTAASNVAFVELGWNPAEMLQAEDRLHRIGQKNAVTAWYLLAENSIEEAIFNLIERKRGVVDAVLDGKTEESTENIVYKLIEQFK